MSYIINIIKRVIYEDIISQLVPIQNMISTFKEGLLLKAYNPEFYISESYLISLFKVTKRDLFNNDEIKLMCYKILNIIYPLQSLYPYLYD